MSTFIIHNPENRVVRDAFLERCDQGLKERYGDPVPQEARDRFAYELAVIEQHELADALYVAGEFAAEARREGVYVAPCPDPARSSLTAYVLGISGIDPLAHGLSFERYLSPETSREKEVMVQLESGRHDDIVSRIEERFGRGVAERLPDSGHWTQIQRCHDNMASVCRLAEECTGRTMAPEDIPVDDEDAFALLRSGSADSATHPAEALYENLDEDAHDFMPADLLDFFSHDWNIALAREETSWIANLFLQLPPERFSDIVAAVALCRPGPLKDGIAVDYVKAASSMAPARCYDERLRPVLEETHGLMLYQEQVMLISMVVAGFSAGKADTLRKAMGGRKRDIACALEEEWSRGAAENGYSPKIADLIWHDMGYYMKHAYDKSWAVTLAALLMRFAYLKAHFPAEWKEVLA